MQILAGKELENYKHNILEIKENWNPRDFVGYAKIYLEGQIGNVLVISGLRGTGKTVGCLQAAENFDPVYLIADKEETATGRDYIDFLKSDRHRCVIIDEYSWIRDRKELDYFLADAVRKGKRVIVTGTESFVLDYLNHGTMIHRADIVHTTMFPYGEYLRVYGKPQNKETCRQYLTEGGVFPSYALTSHGTMQNYIETAIVENLAGYLGKTVSDEKARALTYAVLYKAVCPSNLSSIPVLRKNDITAQRFFEKMRINPRLVPDENDIIEIADIFEQAGIIVRIPNLNTESPIREQYYITNPSLTCQLIKAAYGVKAIDNQILGHVYEAAIGSQLFTNRLSEHDIFFYNNSGNPEGVNRELDFILTGPGQEHAFLFECKFTQNDSPHRNSTLLSGHLEKNELRAADIDGRYVIYNGKPSVQYWDQIKGNVIFTPVGEMLDNYFEFEKNVETIKGKRNDDRDDNNGNNGGLPEQISEKIAEIAEKAKKVVSETAEIIAEHKRKITESFAFADMRQTRPVFER